VNRESKPIHDLKIDDSPTTPPVALTIAGSDCSAGAGLQADLKTFGAFGVFGLTAVTCVVAEMPGKVSQIEGINPRNVGEQIELCLTNFPVRAIKTGLLFSAEIVETVASLLDKRAKGIPLVIDPVMVATSGNALLQPQAIESYRRRLFPKATLVTPNMAEAAALSGRPVRDLHEMRSVGRELSEEFGTRVLLKGGHLGGESAIDLLFDGSEVKEFAAPFVAGVSTHGTGCTYSAAITAALARGDLLDEAIRRGKDFVSRAIGRYFVWENSLGTIHALNHLSLGESLRVR
jgi:hydroxymethylpyrimidine/phosphomethylpyrimidine kinase